MKPLAILMLTLLPLPLLQAQPGAGVWSYPTGGVVFSSPSVGPDGTLYVGSNDNRLYALSPEGQLQWYFAGATDWVDSTPAVAQGRVYAGSWDNHLYALDAATGQLLWSYETASYILGSPAVGVDGAVYIGSGDGYLYCLEPTGTLRWSYPQQGAAALAPIESSPALDREGAVYFGDSDGVFYAVKPDGTLRWKDDTSDDLGVPVTLEDGLRSSPAVAPDGSVVVGSANGRVYAYFPEGGLKWTYDAFGEVDSSPAIDAEGRIYVADRTGYLHCLDASGVPEWYLEIGDVFYAGPALDVAGNIVIAAYAGGGKSQMLWLTADGDLLASQTLTGYNDSSPLLTPEPAVYVGMHDDRLYKFEGFGPPALGGWSAFRNGFTRQGRPLRLLDVMPTATGEGAGWLTIPDFGSGLLYDAGLPNLYHANLGWLQLTLGPDSYVFQGSTGVVPAFGWKPEAPAAIYDFADQTWLWMDPASQPGGLQIFYDFSIPAWTVGEALP